MNRFLHFLYEWLVWDVDHDGRIVVFWCLSWHHSECLLLGGNVLKWLAYYGCNISYFSGVRMALRIVNQIIDPKSVHGMGG